MKRKAVRFGSLEKVDMNNYGPQTNDGRRSVEESTNSTQLGSVRTSNGGYKAVDPAGRVQSAARNGVKVPPAALILGLGGRRRVHYVMIEMF